MNRLVCAHSRQKHSSEVANATWACLALGIALHSDAVDLIAQCDDPAVALLALHCEHNGLLAKPLNKATWMTHMTQQALYDEHWLLAYEANIKGWLPSASGTDHVMSDPNFSFLKLNGVSFYNPTLAAPPASAPVPLPKLPTVSPFASMY
jgi:hypothetical protein